MIDLYMCRVAIQCVLLCVKDCHGNGKILYSPNEFFSWEYAFDSLQEEV